MWIDLVGARVLVCDPGGAWMNKALIVVWRGRGRRSDRQGCASGGVCLSSVSDSLFGCGVRKLVEGKMRA